MNEKMAGLLRSIAGYKNATATPRVFPFPGVSPRTYRIPVVERRDSVSTEYVRDLTQPNGVRKVTKTRKALRHNANEKPILVPDAKGEPAQEMYVVTKPARIGECPRGLYRSLKKLQRKVGLVRLMEMLKRASGGDVDALATKIMGRVNAPLTLAEQTKLDGQQ